MSLFDILTIQKGLLLLLKYSGKVERENSAEAQLDPQIPTQPGQRRKKE